MEEIPIRFKIRELTKKVKKDQELLSDPKRRVEYSDYVDKDKELFDEIKNDDYQSFSLLCEFGSIKALVNERRYDKLQKQSRSTLVKEILNNWKLKYSIKKTNSCKDSDNDESLFNGSFNWDAWFDDHSKINIFHFNNIRYNTLKGLFCDDDGSMFKKRTRTANYKSKEQGQIKETKFLRDEDVVQTCNLKKLECVKNELFEKLRILDSNKKGIEIWDLVLDRNEHYGFPNTCYNLFSLLALLKESKIIINSPSTTIPNERMPNVLVRINDSEISPDLEKNTGIISNFSFKVWKELLKKT